MSVYTAAELTSLFLTSWHVFLIACLLVVFFPGMRQTLGVSRRVWRASQWFIVGVWLSHLGSLFDNSYWGVAWVTSLKAMAAKSWFFQNGVFSNIPFRNVLGIVSTFCHLKAAFLMMEEDEDSGKKNMAEKLAAIGFFLAAITSLAVWFFL